MPLQELKNLTEKLTLGHANDAKIIAELQDALKFVFESALRDFDIRHSATMKMLTVTQEQLAAARAEILELKEQLRLAMEKLDKAK